MTAEDEARRRFRIALLSWSAASVVLAGAEVWDWASVGPGEPGEPAEDPRPVLFVILGLLSIVAFGWLWHHGLFLFDLLFKVGWILFARRAPWPAWREASLKSLRILPWASAAGAVLWLVYALGPFGGWPADAIMGSLANVLGALVYGSIILAWRRVPKA